MGSIFSILICVLTPCKYMGLKQCWDNSQAVMTVDMSCNMHANNPQIMTLMPGHSN